MAGRIHQVENVILAVGRAVIQANGLRLDGDAALALDLHVVEHLVDHLALGEAARLLDQAIGEGRFPMVDMRDDGKIADVGNWLGGHGPGDRRAGPNVQQKERGLGPAPAF